jgi:hypothetical protein
MENVPPAVGVELRWADSLYPTLAGVAELAELRCAGLERVSTETRKWLFHNEVALTEVERGDGILPGIQRAGARAGAVMSIRELESIFSTQVMPAEPQQSTWVSYWTVWGQVAFMCMMKAVSSVGGTPTRLHFLSERTTYGICCSGTNHRWWSGQRWWWCARNGVLQQGLRVSELANLQLCDLLWGHDGAFIAEWQQHW